MLCLYAKRLANENLLPKEIYEKCLERVDSLQVSFVLDRLDYLYKGGRCSALSLLGANIFHIRPQIIVKDGKMIAGKKFRGNLASVVDKYVEDVLSTFNTPDLSNVFITYTTAESETVNKIRQKLIERGFVNIYETTAGATITSHCGENCLGILYINDGQK